MSNAKNYGLVSPISVSISKSACVKEGVGQLRGIFCSSSVKAGIEILDNIENSIPLIAREFPVVGGKYYDFGDVVFKNGLYIYINGDATITVFYF